MTTTQPGALTLTTPQTVIPTDPMPTEPGNGATNAERIVAGSILDALGRTVFVDTAGRTTSAEPAGRAVLLTATPSPDGRIITVRVDPFDGEQVVEIQVLLGPPRVVTVEATGGNGSGA